MTNEQQAGEAALLQEGYRRAAWRLIPFLVFLFILAWIDRVNVGFASYADRHERRRHTSAARKKLTAHSGLVDPCSIAGISFSQAVVVICWQQGERYG